MNYIEMIKDCINKGMKNSDIIRFIDHAYGIHDRGRNPRYEEFDLQQTRMTLQDIKRTRKEMKK